MPEDPAALRPPLQPMRCGQCDQPVLDNGDMICIDCATGPPYTERELSGAEHTRAVLLATVRGFEAGRRSVAGVADAAAGSLVPQGWQPIETAPKDGTPVLVHAVGGVIYVCWHVHGTWRFAMMSDGDWLSVAHPLHWMPLPTPPLLPGTAVPQEEEKE